MLGFWDWEGTYKLVTSAGYVSLVGPNVRCSDWSAWWCEQQGRLPHITAVYTVSEEWYEQWKARYEAKGLLCEGNDVGDGL